MYKASLLPVLIVDDEVQFLQSAAISLRLSGFDVTTCSDSNAVLAMVARQQFGVVILDILMPGLSGIALLPEIIRTSPASQVVMMTAVNEVDTAVSCMRQGAVDYLLKPVEKDRLVTTVKRVIDIVELRSENLRLKDQLLRNQLANPGIFEPIITRSSRMIAIFHYIEAVAQSRMPVLIQGETGTGKELIAQAIHRASNRTGPFVPVNAAGFSDAMFSDSFFGHERGAFTGADTKRDGLVSKAAGGTLFLDEIGDLSMESQIKILRLIEEHTYYPNGSDTQRTSDARIVAATNRDLAMLERKGAFRSDLYFRLLAHKIDLPPLRERAEDLLMLVETFLEEASAQLNKEKSSVPEPLIALLKNYSFPGNIRELKNIIIDAASISSSPSLDLAYFRNRLNILEAGGMAASSTQPFKDSITGLPYLPALKEAEQMLIDEALRRSNGSQAIAAQYLGMTRSALNKRLTRARASEENV